MFEKFLKSIGVDSKTISEIAKAEKSEDKDFDVSTFVDDFKASQKKLMENDPDLVSEIAGKEKGKLLDIYTRKLKQEFGLDSALIKDKPIEEVIKIAKAESTKSLGKDLQTVQQENIDLQTRVKELEEVEIPRIKQETENEKKAFKINNQLQKKIPVDKLRVPAETAELVINSEISRFYDIDLDDKGDLVIFTKGSKLQAKSADGTKLLTIDDVLTDTLSKNKFIKESNADDIDPTTGKKKVTPDSPPANNGKAPIENKGVVPRHLEAAQKHKEALKEAMAKQE